MSIIEEKRYAEKCGDPSAPLVEFNVKLKYSKWIEEEQSIPADATWEEINWLQYQLAYAFEASHLPYDLDCLLKLAAPKDEYVFSRLVIYQDDSDFVVCDTETEHEFFRCLQFSEDHQYIKTSIPGPWVAVVRRLAEKARETLAEREANTAEGERLKNISIANDAMKSPAGFNEAILAELLILN